MKKIDFLKVAVRNNKPHFKKWMLSAFAVVESVSEDLGPYDILQTPAGNYILDEDKNRILLEDAPAGQPIFKFLDHIEIDETWYPGIKGKIVTTIGNLMFNNISILPAFGTKIPFVTGVVSISKLEDKIAPVMQSEPDDGVHKDDTIYVSEYIAFVDSLQYLSSLSSLCVVSATIKNIQIAPGMEEFKKKLIEKYGDSLKDPTVYVKFNEELTNYDNEYLKDDPSMRGFMTGKVKNISRKKLYIAMGSEEGFDSNVTPPPIINSLHEGWPTDSKQFTTLMSVSRHGSFSRGAETVKGGVSAKVLLRSASTFRITDPDCGSKTGIRRMYNKNDISNLVGRYLVSGNTSVLIESAEMANPYIGKAIYVRSPMYCLLKGDRICQTCAGKRLSINPTGLAIPLTDISGIILATSMAAMHGKVMKSTTMDLPSIFS